MTSLRRCSSDGDGQRRRRDWRESVIRNQIHIPLDMTRRRGEHTRRLLLLLLLPLLLLLVLPLLPVARADLSLCNATTPTPSPRRGSLVNVALLFFGSAPPPPHPESRVYWGARSPLLHAANWTGASRLETIALQSWLLFQERLANRSVDTDPDALPALRMADGGTPMRLNISYFSIGPAEALGEAADGNEYSDVHQQSQANALIQQLADPNGPHGRMHFIVPPMSRIHPVVSTLTALACEATRSCIVVGTLLPNSGQFMCGANGPLPADCVARGRRVGERRFEYLVAAASHGDDWGSGSLAVAVHRNVRRVAVVGEAWCVHIAAQLVGKAKQLGIELVFTALVPTMARSWSGSTNTTAAGVTEQLRAVGADMVVMVSSFRTPALREIVEYWRSIDYLPLVVGWMAGGHEYLPADLQEYLLIEVLWLPGLTGAVYRAVDTELNLELFPSNATHDSPAVFADAYVERFPGRPLRNADWYHPARAIHTLTIIQKLLELTQSDDIETLRVGSARIAAPGVFHAVQFDQWGRSLPYDNFVLQLLPDEKERVLTPLAFGQRATLPMPTWDERVFVARFFATTGERVMLVLTALGLVYLIAWLCWGAYWRRHPVIGASTPVFSALVLLGLILFLCSNFSHALYSTDASCAASHWLFMLGFTVATGSLLLKNLRIWALWHNHSHSFAPAKLRQPHLAAALILLVLIDVALNIAWQAGPGMRAVRVVVDPDRPALDFFRCDRSAGSMAFLWTHLVLKGSLLLSGVLLAWKLRKVSEQFSEARYIALCIYNAILLLGIIVSISATNVGGYVTSVLVADLYIVYFVVSTATILAVPKLLTIWSTEARIKEAMGARAAAIARAAEGGISQSALSMPPPPADIDPRAAAAAAAAMAAQAQARDFDIEAGAIRAAKVSGGAPVVPATDALEMGRLPSFMPLQDNAAEVAALVLSSHAHIRAQQLQQHQQQSAKPVQPARDTDGAIGQTDDAASTGTGGTILRAMTLLLDSLDILPDAEVHRLHGALLRRLSYPAPPGLHGREHGNGRGHTSSQGGSSLGTPSTAGHSSGTPCTPSAALLGPRAHNAYPATPTFTLPSPTAYPHVTPDQQRGVMQRTYEAERQARQQHHPQRHHHHYQPQQAHHPHAHASPLLDGSQWAGEQRQAQHAQSASTPMSHDHAAAPRAALSHAAPHSLPPAALQMYAMDRSGHGHVNEHSHGHGRSHIAAPRPRDPASSTSLDTVMTTSAGSISASDTIECTASSSASSKAMYARPDSEQQQQQQQQAQPQPHVQAQQQPAPGPSIHPSHPVHDEQQRPAFPT